VIRLFHIRDLPKILNIEKQSFGADAWPEGLFLEYSRNSRGLFLVVWVGRVAAGYSIASTRKDTAEIASIAVLAEYRGRKLASKLLTRTIWRLRRMSIEKIMLMVRRDNHGAIDLYRKFGFVRTATVHGYYEDGAVAWRMRLVLSK
jgi:[ribosomal protein S18]-alanine N-acetyltransferase